MHDKYPRRKVALLGLTVAADVHVIKDEVCCNWAYLLTKCIAAFTSAPNSRTAAEM